MKSILTGEDTTFDNVKIEADVIVTAVAMGFAGTRYLLDQPFSFDYEHPSPKEYEKWESTDVVGQRKMKEDKEAEFIKETQQFLNVMSAMTFILEKKDPKIGPFLKEAQSAEWVPGALITGRTGGQSLRSGERHRNIESNWAKAFKRRATIDPEVLKLYQGRGAYTGMMNDPVNDNHLFISTKRVIDNDKNRWHPVDIDSADYKPWGLIRDLKNDKDVNLDPNHKKGLGPLPDNKQELGPNERIGYIHGMSSAIVESVREGPWCTPYELATGKDTTKMASCFACTTYMYAAGFPPSSIHLGRGESWVPPGNHLISGEKNKPEMYPYDSNVVATVLARWHREIHHYLNLGTAYLLQAMAQQKTDQEALTKAEIEKEVIDYVNPTHQAAVKNLEAALKEVKLIGERGGNLFLDALTVHESDWKRIQRTLRPVYEHYTNQAAHAFDKPTDKVQLEKKLASGAILVA